jgi:FkbM family methyltransferase
MDVGKTQDAEKKVRVRLGGRVCWVSASKPNSARFWGEVDRGVWEESTFRFIDALTSERTTFVDVGAWIGPITLYASRQANRVIALEPDPVALLELKDNVAANVGNVDVWGAAVSSQAGTMNVYAPGEFGDSSTSSFGGGKSTLVKTVTFADIDVAIDASSNVVLKVDIEGHEYRIMEDLVQFAQMRRAPVHLSLHPRAIWLSKKLARGRLLARVDAYSETISALRKLAALGRVSCETGESVGRWFVFRKVFLHSRRPKNFAVEVRKPI